MPEFKLTDAHLRGLICAYCDLELVDPPARGQRHANCRTKDHVVPKSLGLGYLKAIDTTDIAVGRGNGVYACQHCNELKDSLLPDQLRVQASYHDQRAERLRQIADRAEAIIKKRNLLP